MNAPAATAIGILEMGTHLTDTTPINETQFWVRIDRDESHGERHVVVGPYPTIDDADHALEHALIIDALCEESCFDCYTETGYTRTDLAPLDVYVIDPTNPDHTGR